jgi:hypothetical protein
VIAGALRAPPARPGVSTVPAWVVASVALHLVLVALLLRQVPVVPQAPEERQVALVWAEQGHGAADAEDRAPGAPPRPPTPPQAEDAAPPAPPTRAEAPPAPPVVISLPTGASRKAAAAAAAAAAEAAAQPPPMIPPPYQPLLEWMDSHVQLIAIPPPPPPSLKPAKPAADAADAALNGEAAHTHRSARRVSDSASVAAAPAADDAETAAPLPCGAHPEI